MQSVRLQIWLWVFILTCGVIGPAGAGLLLAEEVGEWMTPNPLEGSPPDELAGARETEVWPSEPSPPPVEPFSPFTAPEPTFLSEPSVETTTPASEDAWGVQDSADTKPARSTSDSLGGDRSPFTARLWWIPQQNVRRQSGDLAMNGEELDVAFPLRLMPDGIWLGLGSFQRLQLDTSVSLPDSRLPVPVQLWDLEVGVMHIRNLENGWRAGGMLRVGSPSDRPFAALRDMTVTLLGFVTIPSGEHNAWNFSLFYSPTGQIIFPIPGVAYVWRPSSQFQANLGIPFSLDYRPTEALTVTASYRPLNNVQVLVRRSLGEAWSVYGAYRTVNETFLLADRLEDRERMYFFDQRLTLGVVRELGSGWSVDFSAAYVFDRQIFQAEKFSGDRRDELMIEPGVAGLLQFVWTR